MKQSGYGIVTDNLEWTFNMYDVLLGLLKRDKSPLLENFADYRRGIEDNDVDETDAFADFCEEYENETFCWNGVEAVIVDHINLHRFRGETVFRYEDCCIYVEPYIMDDRKETWRYPTISEINSIFQDYMNPLLAVPQYVKWHTISTD